MSVEKRLKELLEEIVEEEKRKPVRRKYEEIRATLKFSKEECEAMGATVGNMLLNVYNRVIRVIKRKVGEKYVYILRLRRNGLNIEVEDEDLKKAKQKFQEKTFEIKLDKHNQEKIEMLGAA